MSFGSLNEHHDDEPMSDINVTPLVDVMLVLLIVFMITMPVLTHSIPINLPTSRNQELLKQTADNKPLSIGITAQGEYTIGAESTELTTIEAVAAKLKQVATEDPDTIIAIDADEKTAHEYVVKVLDAAKEAHLSKIGFTTKHENQ